MVDLDADERAILDKEIGAVRSIKPIYPIWQQWAGWGGMTRPGVVAGEQGRCKIVVLLPELRSNATALKNFGRSVSIYRALAGCSALPRLIMQSRNYFIVTEWFEGDLFSHLDICRDDICALARGIGETYSRMEKIPNPMHAECLIDWVHDIEKRGFISPGSTRRTEQIVSNMSIPEHVLSGPCFGDVALKNFVRKTDGSIGYIDTMGVDNAVMNINIEKIMNFIEDKWKDTLILLLSNNIPLKYEVGLHRSYFRIALLIRQIRSKSTGGRGIVAVQRRMRARAAAKQLQSLLRSEGFQS